MPTKDTDPAAMTQPQYRKSLRRIQVLVALDPAQNTPEADELVALSVRVGAYERARWPFPQPSDQDMAAFRKQESGDE